MITARLIIEIAGFPKDHIEGVMKGVMEQIKTTNDVLSYDIFEAKEVEQMWSTFTEMEINFKEFKDLIAFCFDKMPSSIEIIEPENLQVKGKDFEDFLNDLMSKLHEYDAETKQLRLENLAFKKKS